MKSARYSLIIVVFLGVLDSPTAAQDRAAATESMPALSEPQSFNDPLAMRDWSLSLGKEWPGARGALQRRDVGGRDDDGVLVLKYDFKKGGHYVAAIAGLPADPPVKAVRLWVNKPCDNLMIFRAVDADGESFQKNLRFDYRGWQQLEVSLDGWGFHWGGDGVFRPPARRFDILIENQGASRAGEVRIDDVQWVFAPAAAAQTARVATCVESRFKPDDGWSADGRGSYEAGRWSCRYDDHETCNLHWGRSILGRPVTLRLTLESDGSGHELLAHVGSHFQFFETPLGRLDKPGRVTLDVPMGDMRSWKHFGGENDGLVRYPLRLERLVLARRGAARTGTIRLLSLEYTTRYEPADAVALVPAAGRNDSGLATFVAELRSLLPEPLAGTLHCTVGTLDRDLSVTTTRLVVPPAGQRVSHRVTARLDDHPMLEARFRFIADPPPAGEGRGGGFVATPERSVTIAVPPVASPADLVPDPASRVGAGLYLYRFHNHPDRRAWMRRVCRLAAAAGVKWTREEFHWNWIEPTRGEYDFSFFDELVDVATAHGIQIYGIAAYWTDWTGPPKDQRFIGPYCDFLRTLATRYKGRVRHWEIWNEPNIFFWPGPKALYVELVKRAYRTLKDVDPDIRVLACSTAGIDGAFIEKVVEGGAPFDALTVHPYRGSIEPDAYLQELASAQALAGGRDVWITEMGWPSNIGGLTERQQAGCVARTYITSLASPAVRSVAWYDFREDGTDPYYNEHHFGLIRNDLTPKVGYQALATVGRLLGSARFVRALPRTSAGDLFGYLFERDRRQVAAIWSPGRTRLMQLRFDRSRHVRILTATGDEAAAVWNAGGAIVRLERDLPVYVLADGLLDIGWKPGPVRIRAHPATVHPGDPIRLTLETEAGVQVDRPVLPPGWTLREPGDAARDAAAMPCVVVPASACPGPATLNLRVRLIPSGSAEQAPRGDTGVFVLPVEVTVVPRLLRG